MICECSKLFGSVEAKKYDVLNKRSYGEQIAYFDFDLK